MFVLADRNFITMLSSLCVPSARYARLESSSDAKLSAKGWAKESLTSAFVYWRELAIIGLCTLCTMLTYEAVFKPLGGRARVEVQDYRQYLEVRFVTYLT